MDAQRFDLSKRLNPSNPSISIVSASVHPEDFYIPQITVISPPADELWTWNESSSGTDDSTPSSPTVVEPTIFNHKTDTESTDVFERDGYSTTRTIIRPTSRRSSLSSIFSRPSSPAPGAISCPNSPLGTRLANFKWMGSTDAFEEELDFILDQRENDLAGVGQEIKVKVTQDQAVFYEEKWRDAIRVLLYEPTPPVVSCVGHLH